MPSPLKRSTNFLLIAVLTISHMAFSQQNIKVTRSAVAKPTKKVEQSLIEITKQDFTKTESLRSTKLTVFGIRVGQPEQDAATAAEKAKLVWKIGKSGDIEVQETSGKTLMIVYVANGEVEGISLQAKFSEYLKGDAKKLFSPTVLEPQSSFRMAILGREDERKEDGGFLSFVHYTYFKEGIEISGTTTSPLVSPS